MTPATRLLLSLNLLTLSGRIQNFHDKDAIFTLENLDRHSNYPLDGVVGCEIIERGRFVKITTQFPWDIESTEGETIFEVLPEQLVEFEHLE